MRKNIVLEVKKPYYVVRLNEDTLEVDLKEGAKKELEDAIEKYPALRESLGLLFQTIIPLDVALYEIESTQIDDNGRLKIVIPLRRDIIIPTEIDDSKKLVEKLKELIPLAKLREAERSKRIDEMEERSRRRPREPI